MTRLTRLAANDVKVPGKRTQETERRWQHPEAFEFAARALEELNMTEKPSWVVETRTAFAGKGIASLIPFCLDLYCAVEECTISAEKSWKSWAR